jgi:cysteine desulfurase
MTSETMKSRIYLDHNATTPLRPAARTAAVAAMEATGNASSVHAEGRAAHARIDEARAAVAAALGVRADMVVFTSGGSEANNLALKVRDARALIVSAIEHPSVLAAARADARPLADIPVDADGIVDLDRLESLLEVAERPALVSVMLANNETGVIEPVKAVADLVHVHDGLLHVDAVQAAGRIPARFAMLGADLATLSAHKIGGPQGAGALVIGDHVRLDALIRGGGQEYGRRAGTENVAAIAGFGAALGEIARNALPTASLRDSLEAGLKAIAPEITVFGAGATRLANTTCFACPGLDAQTALMGFDLAGIAVSSGAACSSGKVTRSAVLAAMGVGDELAAGAVRISLGWTTTDNDIQACIAAWDDIVARHRSRHAA